MIYFRNVFIWKQCLSWITKFLFSLFFLLFNSNTFNYLKIYLGFEIQTGPDGLTGKTRNRTEILFLKPIESGISELWENWTNRGSTKKTGRTVGRFNWSWNRGNIGFRSVNAYRTEKRKMFLCHSHLPPATISAFSTLSRALVMASKPPAALRKFPIIDWKQNEDKNRSIRK